MNRKELVDAVAKTTGISKANVETIIEAGFDQIATALKGGQEVEIHGFGKFKVKQREQRQGRNPRTQEVVTIAAHKAATFKPAKALADAVA